MLTSSRCRNGLTQNHHPTISTTTSNRDDSPVMLIARGESRVSRPNSEPASPQTTDASPRSRAMWQDSDEVLDLSPCNSDKDETSNKVNDTDPDDVTALENADSDSFADSDVSASHCDVTMVEAKRARVENIVTNIRDRPVKCKSNDSSHGNDTDVTIDDVNRSAGDDDERRRKIEEKLKEIQEKFLHQGGISSPSEFIQQALNLFTTDGHVTSRTSPALHATSWTPPPKRSRMEEPHNDSIDYRGAIKVAIPSEHNSANNQGWSAPDNHVYNLIVETLKRELSFVLDKVTERLAQKVLEELQVHKEVSTSPPSPIQQNDDVFMSERGEKSQKLDCNQPTANQPHPNSSFVIDDRVDHLRTSSQSQLCFGDVEVRHATSAGRSASQVGGGTARNPDHRGHVESPEKLGSPTVGHRSRIMTSNYREAEDKEQILPLSLVTRKSPPTIKEDKDDSLASSGPGRAFVQLDAQKRKISRSDEDPSRSRIRTPGASSRSNKQDFSSYGRASSENNSFPNFQSGSRKNVFSSFFPGRGILPLHDTSFQTPSSWNLSSGTGAFRHPTRHQNGGSPAGHHFSSLHLDAQHKLIANLSSDASHVKPPNLSSPYFPTKSHLNNSLYSPLQTSPLSSYPFPSSQIPFPLIPAFNHGALANALASRDYGRLRDGLESSGLRHLSTRTSTRENSKSRVTALGNHHMDGKCDASDYVNSSADVSPYSAASVQEGLTPQHLKKAKLMFFFTRYPSANTLKTFFCDVKFTRATTSQLIKWFSNFREFYYIQVEKFARQALTEGITDACQLQVSRDSEIFRVLNQHYNKSNDFRVPDKFLEVTFTSLQEFFSAIQSVKDHDPAWKKVIYKVICKLDQDIPEIFKSPNVLEHLNEV